MFSGHAGGFEIQGGISFNGGSGSDTATLNNTSALGALELGNNQSEKFSDCFGVLKLAKCRVNHRLLTLGKDPIKLLLIFGLQRLGQHSG